MPRDTEDAGVNAGRGKKTNKQTVLLYCATWCCVPPLAVFTFLVHELGKPRNIVDDIAVLKAARGESSA